MSEINSSRRNSGGREGHGFKNNNNDGRQKASTTKTLQGFTFYFGSTKQARDYTNTALFAINHTKKYFDRGNDISEALRNLE